MKKILLSIITVSLAASCNNFVYRPMGDNILTIVENKTKGTMRVQSRSEIVLPFGPYTDFTLVDYDPRNSCFIARTAEKDIVYSYREQGINELIEMYSAPSIDYFYPQNSPTIYTRALFIGTYPDGRKEVYNDRGKCVSGPYEDVKGSFIGFIYKKNGLWGIKSVENRDCGQAIYEKIYAIMFEDIRYCTYRGDGVYDVNKLLTGTDMRSKTMYHYFVKTGTSITQSMIDSLRKYATTEYSEYSFEIVNGGVPKNLYDKAMHDLAID